MKKITLFLLLISSLYSDAMLYLGVGHGYYEESYTDVDAQSSNAITTLKIGYGEREAYAIEFSIQNLKNSAKIFSLNDSDKNTINIDLIKAFTLDVLPIPFFKAGIGAGILSIDGQFQDTLHYGSYNLGLGMFIPINKYFDLELSYTQKYISYEGIDTISENVSYTSTMGVTNFGFNLRF